MLTLGLIPGEPNRSTGGRGYAPAMPGLGAGGTIYQSWQEKRPTTSWPPAVPTEGDLSKLWNYWPVHQGWLQTKADYGSKYRTHYATNPFTASGAYLKERSITKKYAALAGADDSMPDGSMTPFQKWTLAFAAISTVAVSIIAVSKVSRHRRR